MDKEDLLQLTKELYHLTVLFPKKEPLRYKIREAADDILACFIMKSKENRGITLKENLEIIGSFFEITKEQNWVSPEVLLEVQEKYAMIVQDLEQQEKIQQTIQAGVFGSKERKIDKKEETNNIVKEQKNNQVEITAVIEKEEEEKKPVNSSIQISESIPLISTTESLHTFAKIEKEEFKEDKKEEKRLDGPLESEAHLTGSQMMRQKRIIEFLKESGRAQVWEIQKIFPATSKRTIRRDFRSLLKQGLIERIGERNKTYYKLKINLS